MKAIWAGTLSFGYVNVPIKMYSAARERKIDFVYLRKKDHCPVGYEKICKTTGEKVAYHEIVRAFEVTKGNYVALDKEDFERADVKKTHSIQIIDFTKRDEVSPIYFEKPYFIEPEQGYERIYVLLREALKKTQKIGIAQFVLKTQEHLGAILPNEDLLILNQMRFINELIRPRGIEIPKEEFISERAMDMTVKLIDEMSLPFIVEKYHDTYTEELKETIEEKAKGRKPPARGEKPKPTPIPDMVNELKESLDQLHKGNKKYTSR